MLIDASLIRIFWTRSIAKFNARVKASLIEPGGSGAERPARARAWSRRRRQSGTAGPWQACRPRAVGHRARRACGADPGAGATPIDYQREDFTRVLPGGFDVVFDGIGEEGYRRSFTALKRGGLLCAYGYSAGVQAQRRMLTMLMWIARCICGGGCLAASVPASNRST